MVLEFFFPKQNSFVETVFVTSGPSTLRGAQFEQKSSANLKKKKNKEIPIFFFQDEHVTVFFLQSTRSQPSGGGGGGNDGGFVPFILYETFFEFFFLKKGPTFHLEGSEGEGATTN